jgi:hypothetical protein
VQNKKAFQSSKTKYIIQVTVSERALDFSIYEKETDEGLRKYLGIKKMGNSKYVEDELPLSGALGNGA